MYIKVIIYKILIFIICFTLIFFGIRYFNLLPITKLTENINSLPWLFSAISVIFSIISGFIIQAKWQTWDTLTDSSRGELSTLRQLHVMAHNFPDDTKNQIRHGISNYLEAIIHESVTHYDLGIRSRKVEEELNKLADIMFQVSKKYPETGLLAFALLNKSIEFRDRRLQTSSHHLPPALRFFIVFVTGCIVISSLFIGVDSITYDYFFTLIIGLLSYGIYLLIDDLDHPYRPGNWHLSMFEYEELFTEIKEKTNK